MKTKQIITVASGVWLELLRRKDVYVALLVGLLILVPLAMINVFDVSNVSRYLNELALLLIWLGSICIGVMTTARQIPNELENRTIYALLSKPVSRNVVILGKYLGSFFASSMAVTGFYLLFGILMWCKGINNFNVMFFQSWILHCAFLGLLCASVLFFSVWITPGANITLNFIITFLMLLFGRKLLVFSEAAGGFGKIVAEILHALLPHYEFFDMRLRLTHNWEALDAVTLILALLYALVYTMILLMLATSKFRKRNL